MKICSRRFGDDRKEWLMGLCEEFELEFESCKTGLESYSFWFQDFGPTSLTMSLIVSIQKYYINRVCTL